MTAQSNLGSVVVGCDGSWQSQAAVAVATREAARRGGPLVLLAVARRGGMPKGLSDLRQYADSTLESARAVGIRAAEVAEATDPSVAAHVVVAPTVDAEEVEEVRRSAALLVLGGTGSRGQAAFSLGSTSRDLARRFRVPVLVPRVEGASARPVDDRHPQVHVGWSGRRSETSLLRLAAREARLRGWSLDVLHAVPRSQPGDRLRQDQDAAWQAVHAVPECAEVPCRVEVVYDEPVAALVSRCAPGDLLLVATRGGGTLAGLVRGSVARGVLDVLPCDVIVVPPSWAAGVAEVREIATTIPTTETALDGAAR
ncbi:MAG TPA: universal stress protein [Dermatophilaceae bacterium]|nr:universal stress protein [Dermatophilaceae bacterium]